MVASHESDMGTIKETLAEQKAATATTAERLKAMTALKVAAQKAVVDLQEIEVAYHDEYMFLDDMD